DAASKGIHSILDVEFGPSDDFDGDGRTNAAEFMDWTDPTDPEDFWSFKPVEWHRFTGTTDISGYDGPGGTLAKISEVGAWDAGAAGRRTLQGDGALRFTIDSGSERLMVGLSEQPGELDLNGFAYA